MIQEILCGNAYELIDDAVSLVQNQGVVPLIVTDPPFNVGYHYDGFNDRMPENVYYERLATLMLKTASQVIVHYPEALHRLSIEIGKAPNRVVTWVYNSNTAKQHRDIAFFGVNPDFKKVKQPYKNPTDKRVQALIAQGKGARLYDWWEINQVKNVSKEKTDHPCQMPLAVMERIIGILPDNVGIIDPFCGSGTTGVACMIQNIPFVGIEMNEHYAEIARSRVLRYLEEVV